MARGARSASLHVEGAGRHAAETMQRAPEPARGGPRANEPSSRRAPATFAAGLALAAAAPAQLVTTDAGVISTALVLAKERFEWLVREEAEELRATTTVGFSPHRRFQIEAALPFVARDVDFATGGEPLQGRQEGLGDAEVAAKWALVRDDDVMRSDRLSVLGNLRLPTSDEDTLVDGVDLGPRAGLGLDQLGGALGLGYTFVRDRHRGAIALRGWMSETRDAFTPGAEVWLDAAWWYRLAPREFRAGVDEVEWRGVIELLTRWQADDEAGGVDVDNGGTTLTAVVGVQAHVTPAFSVEAGALLPLDDTTEPVFGELRRGFLLSLRVFF